MLSSILLMNREFGTVDNFQQFSLLHYLDWV